MVERELRVAARSRKAFWMRQGAALIAMVICLWALLSIGGLMTPNRMGSSLFTTLSHLAFFGCLFAGVLLTADCLSREKREGTLGLLFLTDLKGYDVVLGKLIGTSLNSFYSLLAIFPILAIPLPLGGVTGGEFWRVVAVLINTLFLSLTLGMFVSSLGRNEATVMSVTGAVLAVMTFFPGVITAASPTMFWLHSMCNQFSPMFAFQVSFEMSYRLNPQAYFTSFLVLHLLAWGFLLLATRIVTRTWQDKTARPKANAWSERWQRLTYGNPIQRRQLRERLMAINPMHWLGGRERLQRVRSWIGASVIGGVGFVILLANWAPVQGLGPAALLMVPVHLILLSGLAGAAARCLGEHRSTGFLAQILATRMTAKDIVHGQVLTLRRIFTGPLLFILGCDFVLVLLDLVQAKPARSQVGNMMPWLVAIFLCDLFALGWVGLWLGLKTQKPARAALGAMVRILILPMVCAPFLFASGALKQAVFTWFIISAFVDGLFGLHAWLKVHDEFRFMLTEVPPKPSDYDEDFALLKWSQFEQR